MTDPMQMVLEGKTDAELVELARLGDKDAFSTLVQRHQDAALRFAARLSREAGSASELVQEAILQSYLSIQHLRDPSKFKGWLCGIMLNLRRNRLREQQASVPFDEAFPSSMRPSDLASPERSAEDNELHRAVMETLGMLLPNDRTTLMMFYFKEMSLFQIAAKMGISESAAKVRLHRARKKLKGALERSHPELIPIDRRKAMVRVSVADVIRQEPKDADAHSYMMCVVILKDEPGERALPIWIGLAEGQAIASGIAGCFMPRPMTFELMAKMLEAAKVSVEHVRVESLKEDTYYAVIRLRMGDRAKEVDARPSDALALAVRLECPVFAAEAVFQKAAVGIPQGSSGGGAGIRSIVKELEGIKEQFKTGQSRIDRRQARRISEDLIADVFK